MRYVASLGGTLTLRRIGPVERDSASGRSYARLAGTMVYQQCGGAFQGQQFCAADTAVVGVYYNDPQGVAAYAHGYGTYVDEAGRVRLVAGSTYGGIVGAGASFQAALAPTGGRLSGTATLPALYSHGAPEVLVPGTMTAERVP